MSETTEKSMWVVNTTDEDFEAIVFEGSKERLVVVDFWAEWCAPCRALGPVLEKLADEFAGRFLLAKANTDNAQRAAAEFQVSGIPAVFAMLDGNIVDSFQGAMPEAAIRDWINKQLAGTLLLDAKRLASTDPVAAESKLREILEQAPSDSNTLIPLAELLLAQNRSDECRQIIESLEKRGFLESSAEKIKAALELGSRAGMSVEAAREEAAASPKNFELQLKLAEVLAGHQEYEQAFEICLTLVALDRKQTGEKARALMVDVFRVLPEDSELTRDYRRKLSMALY
jgi:putative thioredoxin